MFKEVDTTHIGCAVYLVSLVGQTISLHTDLLWLLNNLAAMTDLGKHFEGLSLPVHDSMRHDRDVVILPELTARGFALADRQTSVDATLLKKLQVFKSGLSQGDMSRETWPAQPLAALKR